MQTPLPVDAHLDAIVALVRTEKRAVVIAPPGAGKTTRIPPALATSIGRTILLQPRRVAARALARRIAAERNWTLGEEIGWQIRFERRFRARTSLLVATEGILTARLQSDPLLSDFAVVVLDEFHERSIHADLALALVKQAAAARDDLAVVVMSATMDAAPVARFLGAQVIAIDARNHPIELRYAPNVTMAQAVREVAKTAAGHILCFLPGAREIEGVRTQLAGMNVLPLHGSLDVDAQERALAPSGERKIILATNVAETSLTVEGVTDVIDSGLQKVLRFDPETAVDHLETEQISRDSADQRAGRAGRTGPGRATRLWDERMILRPHREPDVRRVDLASPVLDILAWGGDPLTFEWFERPPEHRIEAAVELLRRIRAVEDELHRFPIHPRLARVLHDAGEAGVRVCALLSEDVRSIGSGDALALADSPRLDHAARELWSAATRVAALEGGRPVRQRRADETSALQDVRRALLAGYPDRVAMRREPGSMRVLLSSGTGAVLAKESGLHGGGFLVALDVRGGQAISPVPGQAGLPVVHIATPIEREWLTPTHEDVVHEWTGDRVRATKRVWYDALLLNEINVAPDPEEVRRLTPEKQIDPESQRRLALGGPERLDLPSGRSARLEYRDDGSVFASVKLQELFGFAETPRVGRAQTPVTFELLAPNGLPVQITRDLRSFWNGAYKDVRKELRGRYPRHPWPEDPWTATATHRTKRR
ncbi:MAG TPA: ATP-dependent helicase C-terminal domain-containing protein [Thermoanaerobaculia bacterium]|nr:ATP-dependent helicase C-terminal domain-containing protein [Thermoanaerobaculia bacterium]